MSVCGCGCGCDSSKSKKDVYTCGVCGKTSAKPGKCCGKSMKKSK